MATERDRQALIERRADAERYVVNVATNHAQKKLQERGVGGFPSTDDARAAYFAEARAELSRNPVL